MNYLTLIPLVMILVILLLVRYEQKDGSKKSELDEHGLSEKIRNEGIEKIGIHIALVLKKKKNYLFKNGEVVKKVIRNRIQIQPGKEEPERLYVYFKLNRKKGRECLFSAVVKSRRELWRYYTDVQFRDGE